MDKIDQNFNRYRYQNSVPMQSLGQSSVTPNPVPMEGQNQVKENPILSALFDENFDAKDRKLTFLLTAPIMVGLFKLMSLFSWANKGDYDKSFVGRLANWGDKVSNGKLANSSFGKFVSSTINKGVNFGKNIVNKSKILTAIFKMPTIPENSMVKGMLTGSKEEITGKFVRFVEKYVGKDTAKFADLGLTEAEFNVLKSNPLANMDRIKDICKKTGDKFVLKFDNYLGSVTNRKVTLGQIGNELKAITEPTSKLGKFLPKAAIRGLHGLTFGGGLWMLMSAFALAKAVPITQKAEKGDKFPTFMEEFLGNISWVVTMPLGIKLMNAIGGMKYIGMSPDDLRKYRQMFNVHNATQFADESLWKASDAKLKALRNSGKTGFFGRIAKWVGSFISTGREVVKPYIRTGANLTTMDKVKNFFALAKFKGKNWLAYPIGFLTYMFLFAPIVDKLFVGASHMVFGKPKHSKHDEHNEPEQINKQPQQNPLSGENIEHQSPTNLINMRNNGQTYIPEPVDQPVNKDNYTYIPSPEGVIESGKGNIEPERHYIPSPEGVKLKGEDPTLANQAMMRADAAEKMALETLAMKW